jgi:hypothetical protein
MDISRPLREANAIAAVAIAQFQNWPDFPAPSPSQNGPSLFRRVPHKN